jgi:uncharacterized SAM-binding protein YcdF (DUF218 family)
MRRSVARTAAVRVLFATVTVLVAVAGTAPWWLPRLGTWTSGGAQPATESSDAIVVFAGDNGRIEEGIRLFLAGAGRELWHTGTDAGAVEQAIREGIPREAVRLLRSDSTWEDAEQVSKAARQARVKRLLIVTSWYHGRRALRTLEKHTADVDLTLFVQTVAPLGHDQRNWWNFESGRNVVRSEILKSFYYRVKYGVPLR